MYSAFSDSDLPRSAELQAKWDTGAAPRLAKPGPIVRGSGIWCKCQGNQPVGYGRIPPLDAPGLSLWEMAPRESHHIPAPSVSPLVRLSKNVYRMEGFRVFARASF